MIILILNFTSAGFFSDSLNKAKGLITGNVVSGCSSNSECSTGEVCAFGNCVETGKCFDTDADEGENSIYVEGSVIEAQSKYFKTKSPDICTFNNLRERTCENGVKKDVYHYCEYGCADGEARCYTYEECLEDQNCANQLKYCVEEDDGYDLYSKSNIKFVFPFHSDGPKTTSSGALKDNCVHYASGEMKLSEAACRGNTKYIEGETEVKDVVTFLPNPSKKKYFDCPSGEICENGLCVDKPSCTPDCGDVGSTACDENGDILVCGFFDSDPCLDLKYKEACNGDCKDGICFEKKREVTIVEPPKRVDNDGPGANLTDEEKNAWRYPSEYLPDNKPDFDSAKKIGRGSHLQAAITSDLNSSTDHWRYKVHSRFGKANYYVYRNVFFNGYESDLKLERLFNEPYNDLYIHLDSMSGHAKLSLSSYKPLKERGILAEGRNNLRVYFVDPSSKEVFYGDMIFYFDSSGVDLGHRGCVDSDGDDLFTKGYAEGGGIFMEDSCDGEKAVRESTCVSENRAGYDLVFCRLGCDEGVCRKECEGEKGCDYISPICHDSDGLDPNTKGYVQGTAFDSTGDGIKWDKCHYSGSAVLERSCGSGANIDYTTIKIECDYGCEDGACLPRPSSEQDKRNVKSASIPQEETPVSSPDSELNLFSEDELKHMIAYSSGKVNQHLEDGEWKTDPDGTSGATINKLTYCKKFYPDTVSVEEHEKERIEFYGLKNTNPSVQEVMTFVCVQSDYEDENETEEFLENNLSTQNDSEDFIVCSDSEGEVNYYSKGVVEYNGNYKIEDVCISGTNTLFEYSCSNEGKLFSERYECEFGCEEGEGRCFEEPQENNSSNSLKRLLGQDSSCSDLDGEVCNSNEVCAGEVRKGIRGLREGEVCCVFGECEDDSESEENVCEGCLFERDCYSEGFVLKEFYCSSEKNDFVERRDNGNSCEDSFECLSGFCEGGKCVPSVNVSMESDCSSGCFLEGKCYNVGVIVDQKYCSENLEFMPQKREGSVCTNNHECSSSVCFDNECVSLNFFQKLLAWLRGGI